MLKACTKWSSERRNDSLGCVNTDGADLASERVNSKDKEPDKVQSEDHVASSQAPVLRLCLLTVCSIGQ